MYEWYTRTFFPSVIPNRGAYLEKLAFRFWKMLPSIPNEMRMKIWKALIAWEKVMNETWDVCADYLVYDTAEQYWNILKPERMRKREYIKEANSEQIAAAETIVSYIHQQGLRTVKMNKSNRDFLLEKNYLCYKCEAIPLRAKAYGKLDWIFLPEHPHMKFTVSNVGLQKKDGDIAWAKPVNNYWPTREPKHYVSEAEKRANCMRVDVRSIDRAHEIVGG